MAKVELKQPIVEEISANIKDAQSVVLVDYLGLSVAEDTQLRKQLREAGVTYKVYKNTLMNFAFKGTDFETAPTLLAQQEPDTPYPAETMLSVRMMPPGERSLRNFLYPKLMAQEGSIQLPAGTSYNLLVQTLDNMRNDYPELFHIDSYRVHYQRNQPDVAQSISPRYLCSAEEASALRKQLLETAQSWVDENPDPLALYERLVQNTTYSPDSMWQHAAVGALLYGEATCAGYAQAISLLYRLAGIPCATIIGEASDTSGETGLHAWNVTNFGFLDATWGAAFDGHVFHSNYAMGEADMSIDHTPNRGYTFPDLSGVPNYYQAHGLYVSTEQELLTQLMRLVDGETVEIQLSPDLYARYTAAMKDKQSDIVTFCAEAAGAEIPFYDPCRILSDKAHRVLLLIPHPELAEQ